MLCLSRLGVILHGATLLVLGERHEGPAPLTPAGHLYLTPMNQSL